jgi:hypothetical protein
MAILPGIFFSLISVLGLVRCQSKPIVRKFVLVAFSVILILGQVLFVYSVLQLDGGEFVAFSGLLGGIILILAFQKPSPE